MIKLKIFLLLFPFFDTIYKRVFISQSTQWRIADIFTFNIAFASFFIAITVRECYNNKRIIIFKEVYLWLLVIKSSGSS